MRLGFGFPFLVACTQRYNPLSVVGQSIGLSIIVRSFGVYEHFFHDCSCHTLWFSFFITLPAHPHATMVAVYLALLVACYATLHPPVCPSVGRLAFYFFGVFELFEHTDSAQMP